ncbi:MAG: hypothetical protein AAFY28_16090 [Actinomycetota bacterium]
MAYNSVRRWLAIAGAGVVAVMAAVAVQPGQVAAVTINSEAELRAAFADSNETEVTFGADVSLTDCSPGTLARPGGAVALVVDGAGFTLTQTCVGERVITNDDGSLEIRNLTVTGGALDAGVDEGFGGGIFSAGALTLVQSVVTGNRADGDLGGAGGGVASDAALRVEASMVTGNTAGAGTGIWSGRGGGIYSDGPTDIVDSVVADNTAEGAPSAGGSGGGLFINERLLVQRSTVSGNTAAAGGQSGGGTFGAAVSNGAFDIVNSTVHANAAAGPMSAHGGVNAAGELSLVYSAVTANSAETGSANVLFKRGDRSTASVVAEAQGGAPDCSADVGSSGGYNFGGDTSCGFVAGTDVQGAGDPGLGALGALEEGVRVPSADGPLVDVIPAGDCFLGDAAGVSTDQLGLTRPQGGFCEIGPVELGVEPPPTDPSTTDVSDSTVPDTTVPATTEPSSSTSTATTAAPSTTTAATVPSPGDGGGTPSTEPPGDPSGPLPATGTSIAIILLVAAGLLGVGLIVRRRANARPQTAD